MVEFNFYLSREDTERLFYLKEKEGKDDLTGNEYAKELLEGLLWKLARNDYKGAEE